MKKRLSAPSKELNETWYRIILGHLQWICNSDRWYWWAFHKATCTALSVHQLLHLSQIPKSSQPSASNDYSTVTLTSLLNTSLEKIIKWLQSSHTHLSLEYISWKDHQMTTVQSHSPLSWIHLLKRSSKHTSSIPTNTPTIYIPVGERNRWYHPLALKSAVQDMQGCKNSCVYHVRWFLLNI
jgi:hypothetical protein